MLTFTEEFEKWCLTLGSVSDLVLTEFHEVK